LEPGKAASSQPGPGPLQRKPVQWKHDVGMPQVDAKVFLPPGASLSKESTWHHRWKISAKYLGQRSRCFQPGDVQADNAALSFCLRLAWGAWTKQSGEECPWELGDTL